MNELLGEEPEIELALVWRLGARALLTELCAGTRFLANPSGKGLFGNSHGIRSKASV